MAGLHVGNGSACLQCDTPAAGRHTLNHQLAPTRSHPLPPQGFEYVAIFDADFEPPEDFLYQTVIHMLRDDNCAFVQTRWTFTNSNSLLTWAQKIGLDFHFYVEQRWVMGLERVVSPCQCCICQAAAEWRGSSSIGGGSRRSIGNLVA